MSSRNELFEIPPYDVKWDKVFFVILHVHALELAYLKVTVVKSRTKFGYVDMLRIHAQFNIE